MNNREDGQENLIIKEPMSDRREKSTEGHQGKSILILCFDILQKMKENPKSFRIVIDNRLEWGQLIAPSDNPSQL